MAWNPNIPAVTNRVQDDLDAIRENFQVLDAHLADTNNPHNVQAQQVPYSSSVSGFTPTSVKAALDALAGVRIVEMGSNSNGEYVRWENGLQVCWRSFYQTRPTMTATGSLYRDDDYTTWTFPAAFASDPKVYGSVLRAQDDDYRLFFSPIDVGTIAVTYRDVATARGQELARTDQLLAIGRWK